MQLILQRYSDDRRSTLGMLFQIVSPGGINKPYFHCYTLEDEFRVDKVMSETRIPAGTYKLGLQKADTPMTLKYRAKYPWFKSHIEILNVPNFTGVYLHVGNHESDTAGCVLLGDTANNNNIGGGEIGLSVQAFRRFYTAFYEHIEKGGVTLTIRDEKHLLT